MFPAYVSPQQIKRKLLIRGRQPWKTMVEPNGRKNVQNQNPHSVAVRRKLRRGDVILLLNIIKRKHTKSIGLSFYGF